MEPKAKRAKITDFQPDPANPNKGSERGYRMLNDSLRKLGAGRSIVVDKNGIVIAGNKTQKNAVDIGLEDAIVVPTDGNQIVVVQRTDLDLLNDPDHKARHLSIADNRTSDFMEWDTEQLAALVDADLNLSDWFQADELAELLAGLEQDYSGGDDPGADLDRAGELQAKWQTARGQVWEVPSRSVLGRCHRVMCGDSTSAGDVARLMGGELSALVVTDPPYGVSYADKNKFLNAVGRGNHIQTPIENDHASKEETQELWRVAFCQMNEVMRPGAVVYCFMPQGGDQMMMMMMMMGAGIEPRHELIWLKNNHVLGRADYAYKHEPILYAWKAGGHKYYGGFQTSIIEVDKPLNSDLHPTMKPVELIEKLINNSSRNSELVYDPFLGSGTTLVACEQTGRIGYGMEIAPEYVAVILERLAGMGLAPRVVE